MAHNPGQESGNALVKLLWGESNDWGKLPYTVAKNETEYAGLYQPGQPEGQYVNFPQVDYNEGQLIDYKYIYSQKITPRYEFGYGLSYTKFTFSDLKVDASKAGGADQYPSGDVAPGGMEDLWDILFTVTVALTNSGAVDGSEVAQLYIGVPNGPEKQLRGFERVSLKAGASTTVTFELTRRDLSVWDTDAQLWKLQSGTYQVWAGHSSLDLTTQVQAQV